MQRCSPFGRPTRPQRVELDPSLTSGSLIQQAHKPKDPSLRSSFNAVQQCYDLALPGESGVGLARVDFWWGRRRDGLSPTRNPDTARSERGTQFPWGNSKNTTSLLFSCKCRCIAAGQTLHSSKNGSAIGPTTFFSSVRKPHPNTATPPFLWPSSIQALPTLKNPERDSHSNSIQQ